MNIIIITVALLVAGFLAFSPRLNKSTFWQATATPLASIMGSGFLISAPLLAGLVGNLALLSMTVLLVVAYSIGAVMRYNIQYFEPIEHSQGTAQSISYVSRIILVGAYFITVSYYLQLLAAFLLGSLGITSQIAPNIVSSVLIILISGFAIWKGLAKLGGVEKYATSINLGMIAALLVALALYNFSLFSAGNWKLANIPSKFDQQNIRVVFGLLIMVQGFETSRYLGGLYSASERIRSMRLAQQVSSVIYLLFIALCTVLFTTDYGADVTAIMKMTAPVAVVLPILLAVAAIGSQFSAAVADAEGAGGLIEDISQRRVSIRLAYLIIMIVALSLTWATDVNTIISYASRAFALYYFLQCLVAILTNWTKDVKNDPLRQLLFIITAIACLIVFVFGLPSG